MACPQPKAPQRTPYPTCYSPSDSLPANPPYSLPHAEMSYYKVVVSASFIAFLKSKVTTSLNSNGRAHSIAPEIERPLCEPEGGAYLLNQPLMGLSKEEEDGYVVSYDSFIRADIQSTIPNEPFVDWLDESFDNAIAQYPALTPDNLKLTAIEIDSADEEDFDWADEPIDTDVRYFPSAPPATDSDAVAGTLAEDDFDWSDEPLDLDVKYFPQTNPASGHSDEGADIYSSGDDDDDAESEHDDDDMPLTPSLSDSLPLRAMAPKRAANSTVYEDPSRVLVAPLVGPTVTLSAPPAPTLEDLANLALGLFVFQEEYDEDFLFPYW